MSEYFSNFPRIQYDIAGTNSTSPDYTIAVNLLIRQKFRAAIEDDITTFYDYIIPENISRPEILSYQVYGDVRYTWIIFLINNIFDPYWNWPMDEKKFKNYLTDKYGSVDTSKTIVHHYEKILTARVEATGTSDPIPERTVEIDYTTYRSTGIDDRRIVYIYDYEKELNEAKRTIKMVDPSFVTAIMDEARQVFR